MNNNIKTGYMLGNALHTPVKNDQWCNQGTNVWVCKSLDVAKDVLQMSHKPSLEPHIVWTTIYRVILQNPKIDADDGALMWTRDGHKIIVDGAVYYREPEIMSEQRLLRNAAVIRPYFSRLITNRERIVR